MTARFATYEFEITGSITPLMKSSDHRHSRPLGGWLMTYGQVDDDGAVHPTIDRDGHNMEAARELGHIDWSPYLDGGLWNDTHNEEVIVGAPTRLEFHDGSTDLSLDHRKVGFWTEGHLWDRANPASWEGYLDRKPTEREFARADHFWRLAQALQGLPRPLGFSAHGSMALSPCGKRITWCQVRQAAVCELPKNPDATAEMLKGGPLGILSMRKSMPSATANPCARCKCPPWACSAGLRKADAAAAPITPEDVEGGAYATGVPQYDALVHAVMHQFMTDKPTAERWVNQYIRTTPTSRTL